MASPKKTLLTLLLLAPLAAAPLRLAASDFKPRLTFGVRADAVFLTNPAWLKAVKTADDILVRNQLGDFRHVIDSTYAYTTFLPGASIEAALTLTPDLSLALGVGLYGQSWTMGGTYDSRSLPGQDLWGVETAHGYKLRIIPVTLDARYVWLDAPGFRLEVTSGAGIYFAGLDYDKTEANGFQSYWNGSYVKFITSETCRDGSRSDFGFRFGLRGEIRLAATVRLLLEAALQIVPLGDIAGTVDSIYTQYENGQLTYTSREQFVGRLLTDGGTSLSGVLLRVGLLFGAR
jgi:hypothetical protein